jgi:transcriptional regulator with GAF, ATPase, and Fis domain
MTTRRRKTPKVKRRKEATAARRHRSTAADLQKQLDQRTRERDEALEQRAATSEVMKIISSSQKELQPVLEAVVQSAARFCKAEDVTIFELDGQDLRAVAHWGPIPQDIGARFPCSRGHVAGRTVLECKPIQVLDLQAEAESAFPKRFGQRTTFGVPLLHEGEAIGRIQLRRVEIDPFTNEQMALLGTFATQAVIAIENARLLNELRQRTDDLSEALEHQTATGEILSSISDSITDAKPVFDAIVRNLRRLFGTRFAMVQVLKDDIAHLVAAGNESEFETLRRQFPRRLDESTGSGRAMVSKQVVQFAPALTDPATPSATRQFARELGFNLGHLCAHAPGGQGHRRHWHRAVWCRAFRRQAGCADQDVRRPSGDRDRERAAIRGRTGAHARADRIAPAADRHRRRAQGHQSLDL